jgi:outer membrane protein assembly factor BamB/predicted Ser/Thr protein kinase
MVDFRQGGQNGNNPDNNDPNHIHPGTQKNPGTSYPANLNQLGNSHPGSNHPGNPGHPGNNGTGVNNNGRQGDHGVPNSDDTTRLQQGATYQLAPGTLVQGRYRIERVLGKGGMGHVYLVRDEHFRGAASLPLRSMKEMIPHLSDLQNNMINFTREALVLESLRHPNIPRIYDSFQESHRAYLVLEYVEGQDLEQVLERTPGLLKPAVVTDWMLQLCDIVATLHTQTPPIIFRDLKPSNVILTPNRRIVLIDFGIAKVFQADEPHTNVGTHGYAAPEMYERKAETRSDIYSLGAMMHHLLTHTDPRFQAPFSFAERMPTALNPAVSPELEAVVMRCLEKDLDKRYQTIFDLRRALEVASGLPPTGDTGHFRAIGGNGHFSGGYGATGAGAWGAGPAASVVLTRPPRVHWTFQTEEEVRSTPTVTRDTVYIGSYDNNLYAVDRTAGKMRWKYSTEGGVCAAPAVWLHLVIFGSEDFNVYGVEAASGKEVWRYRTWNHVRTSPRVFEDKLYVGSDDAYLHAIDPRHGSALWRCQTYRAVQSSVAYANEIIYFGSGDEHMYAVDALTGNPKWKYRTQAGVMSSPVVADGYVYFGSMDFAVYALDAKSGWLAWREPTDRFVIGSPLLVGDRLYVGSTDHHLHCFDRRTGQRLWKYPAGQQVNATPAHADGRIYFGCVDGAVYCLDATSGKLLWRFATNDKVCGSPVVYENVVYVGSCDGSLYALDATP